VIGWYVHHHGSGHLTRARVIAARLAAGGHEVVGLSSRARPVDAPFTDWLTLPRDDEGAEPADVTAGGTLHWAPRRDGGVARRLAALTRWIAEQQPAALVVDVSVEVAVAARLASVPTVVVAMPGDRDDPAHQLGYRSADAILAFWPRAAYDPPWLRPHAERVAYLGAVSRYDGRARTGPPEPRTVTVLGGLGEAAGAGRERELAAAMGSTEGWRWRRLDATHWADDPWDALCRSAVVVSHAGQNAVAEVAAAGRPAIVVAQRRPHDEQVRTAQALAAAGIVTARTGWPEPDEWPGLLQAAAGTEPSWERWSTGDAAGRAAQVVASVAERGRPW
jgi:UDP-N-acetylglucosamine--N-acetylmuramyl-(pentapeptide) pyrophosphoryl-undecaprenol N-acetylglucosamine transferase